MTIYRFYVYAYLRQTDSDHGPRLSPYYIGKGTGKRAYYKYGGTVKPPTDKSLILILAVDLTEDEAYEIEEELVRQYGRINNNTGILRNRVEGGRFRPAPVFSQQTRDQLSKSLRGKRRSDKQKQRYSESKKGDKNPRYGKPSTIRGRKFTEEEKKNVVTANKKRSTNYVLCNETGIKYENYTEAATWLKSIGFDKASRGPINLAATGKREAAYGYHWSLEPK